MVTDLIESDFQLFVWFKAQPTTCVGLASAVESQQNPGCNRATSHTGEATAAGRTDRNVFVILSGSNHSSELFRRARHYGGTNFRETCLVGCTYATHALPAIS